MGLRDALSFCFSHCSRGSQGKNTEVVCHSLLQGTTFCQTSPPWSGHPGWPHTAWLSVTELDKAVVLGSDWPVFCDYGFSVCPLMPSRNTYRLTWVSLTLDVGCLFTAAPAKRSRCSLPWTRGISSRPPLLTLDPPARRSCSLEVGLLLLAAAPDLGRGVTPLRHAFVRFVAATT